MRILAFDHFFEQDLDALSSALAPGEMIDALPYQRLLRLAKASVPSRAFSGADAAAGHGNESGWRRFLQAADRFADWLVTAHRPNVFVVPSDTMFYLRPVIERLSGHGIHTVVVQKETSISPMVMHEHAIAVGQAVPFMSDAMTVCSERHRAFWVRGAGADPDRIVVTGQPRFDLYVRERGGQEQQRAGRPRLLYLSYEDSAYLPSDRGATFAGSWSRLRQETERAIVSVANHWEIVVKPHPQQRGAGDELGRVATRAPRDADTRRLVLAADAVVGFQTTTLFEAAAAGKPVIYAAWGATYEEARPLLLPFDQHSELATHARSPEELARLLAAGAGSLPEPGPSAAAVIEEHLGPLDGQAAERALSVVRRHSRPSPATGPAPAGAIARGLALGVASPLLRLSGAVLTGGRPRSALGEALARRSRHWAQEGQEALTVGRGRRLSPGPAGAGRR